NIFLKFFSSNRKKPKTKIKFGKTLSITNKGNTLTCKIYAKKIIGKIMKVVMIRVLFSFLAYKGRFLSFKRM
ncbi:hypothetical protein J7J12_01490, partial [bacterium]|nr:hypothetical protein [bacterium]